MGLKAALVGRGRMGRALSEVLAERGHEVVACLGRGADLAAARAAEVTFEFTHPAAAEAHVLALLGEGVATVCGTTGWDASRARDRAAELGVPLLVAPNFSLGIAVLRRLAEEAARHLLAFPEFEAGIAERHHRRKVDAPSGTARLLAAALEQGSGRGAPQVVALRLGGQPGEHQVVFEGPDEALELTHRARSPRLFAQGAVRAAEWLAARRPRGAVTFEQFFDDILKESRR